jgi:type IV secretory pathway ATPase VirB11/archaellum biosynthesis ATPase
MLQIFKTDQQPNFLSNHFGKEDLLKEINQDLNRGQIPDWPKLKNQYTDDLKNWFYQVIKQEWLKSICKKYSFQELIGHHLKFIQVKNLRDTEYLSCPFEEHDWQLMLEVLAHENKKEWNVRSPECSFPLLIDNQNYRMTLIHYSLSPKGGSKFFLRRHHFDQVNLNHFGLDINQQQLIKSIINSGDHFLIAGSTNSGKTTFLHSCMNLFSSEDHPVILEETPELESHHPSATFLTCQEHENRSIESLIKYSMRISPTRLIVGEIRGKEALAYLMLMNTGHKSVYSTLHASTAIDAVDRLAQLFCLYSDLPSIKYEEVLRMICRNVKYVFFLKEKKIQSLIQILGIEGTHPFYDELISL